MILDNETTHVAWGIPTPIAMLGAHLEGYIQTKPAINTLRLCHRYGQASIQKLPNELIDMVADYVRWDQVCENRKAWAADLRCRMDACGSEDHFAERELRRRHFKTCREKYNPSCRLDRSDCRFWDVLRDEVLRGERDARHGRRVASYYRNIEVRLDRKFVKVLKQDFHLDLLITCGNDQQSGEMQDTAFLTLPNPPNLLWDAEQGEWYVEEDALQPPSDLDKAKLSFAIQQLRLQPLMASSGERSGYCHCNHCCNVIYTEAPFYPKHVTGVEAQEIAGGVELHIHD